MEAIIRYIKWTQNKTQVSSEFCTKDFIKNPPEKFNEIDIERAIPFWVNKSKIYEKYNNDDKLGRMFFYAFKKDSDKKIAIWADFIKKDGRWILSTQSDQMNLHYEKYIKH